MKEAIALGNSLRKYCAKKDYIPTRINNDKGIQLSRVESNQHAASASWSAEYSRWENRANVRGLGKESASARGLRFARFPSDYLSAKKRLFCSLGLPYPQSTLQGTLDCTEFAITFVQLRYGQAVGGVR